MTRNDRFYLSSCKKKKILTNKLAQRHEKCNVNGKAKLIRERTSYLGIIADNDGTQDDGSDNPVNKIATNPENVSVLLS